MEEGISKGWGGVPMMAMLGLQCIRSSTLNIPLITFYMLIPDLEDTQGEDSDRTCHPQRLQSPTVLSSQVPHPRHFPDTTPQPEGWLPRECHFVIEASHQETAASGHPGNVSPSAPTTHSSGPSSLCQWGEIINNFFVPHRLPDGTVRTKDCSSYMLGSQGQWLQNRVVGTCHMENI